MCSPFFYAQHHIDEAVEKATLSLRQQLAETHRLWQESCNDAFEKSKQLAAAVSHGESTIAAQDFRRIALEERLTSANTTICAMTEGLQTISRQPEDHWSKFVAVKILGDAFSFPPTCLHKEGVGRLKEERDKWKRGWEQQLTLLDQREGPLVYSSVLQRAETAEAELASLQEADIKNHEIMADLTMQLASLREALESIKRRGVVMGSTGDYRQGQLDVLHDCKKIAEAALSSHESKWPVKKEG